MITVAASIATAFYKFQIISILELIGIRTQEFFAWSLDAVPRHRSLTLFLRLLTFCSGPAQSRSDTFFTLSSEQIKPSRPGRPVVALSSSLDDDAQGAKFLAPRIPIQALPKKGPCYA